jgi:hypothetical protein
MLKTIGEMLKTTCKPFKYNGKSFLKYLLKCCKTFFHYLSHSASGGIQTLDISIRNDISKNHMYNN